MEGFISGALSSPLANICVIAGIVFLLLAVSGSLAGQVQVRPERQLAAGAIGAALLATGVFFALTPSKSGEVVVTPVPPQESRQDISEIERQIEALENERQRQLSAAGDAGSAVTDALVEQERQQREALERNLANLQRAKEEAEANLKQQLALAELKGKIIEYYNTRSTWKGVFTIERVEAIRLDGLVAHAKYKYVPVQGNAAGRREIGWDTRTFSLRRDGDGYRVVGMGPNNSGRI